ncbi:MAG: iron-containing alcohol dehydrogenase [Gammaproteobacteria bacterium]|nr:iron-containing alcohol dehydrogenase [Gammaproteobacteria bacterium]
MNAFEFNTVANTTFGNGRSAELGHIAGTLGMQKPLVVTDPGILEHGLFATAEHGLKEAGAEVVLFSDVVADPPEQTIFAALDLAKTNQCDGVIGFGGGSSMDVAKLIAVLMAGDQALPEIYGVDMISGTRAPLIQVPTTAGTGSEATAVAIVTTGESTKAGVVSKVMLADHIILDPELTLGLPPHVTAATGIDAMVHAIEAFTSKRLKNPMSDMVAIRALQLMAPNIETAVKQGDDLTARSAMLLGAMYAGQAFANAPVAAVHALAYPLGGTFHIAHGLSNSLVLPHVLRFNATAATDQYQQLAQIILGDRWVAQGDHPANQLADYFLALARDLGLQTTLREMSIADTDLDNLAEQAMLQQRLLINNPREVALADARAIYQQAF